MMQRLTYRRTTWIVDAHCDDVTHFVVHADEKLTRVGDMSKTRPIIVLKPTGDHSPRSVPHAHGKSCQDVEAKLQVVVFASR
jgi:hypothetical protein